jgi:hypothetical protein
MFMYTQSAGYWGQNTGSRSGRVGVWTQPGSSLNSIGPGPRCFIFFGSGHQVSIFLESRAQKQTCARSSLTIPVEMRHIDTSKELSFNFDLKIILIFCLTDVYLYNDHLCYKRNKLILPLGSSSW